MQVWDAHAPNLGLIELAKFKAHKFTSVVCLDLSPDGNTMASGACWRAAGGGLVRRRLCASAPPLP